MIVPRIDQWRYWLSIAQSKTHKIQYVTDNIEHLFSSPIRWTFAQVNIHSPFYFVLSFTILVLKTFRNIFGHSQYLYNANRDQWVDDWCRFIGRFTDNSALQQTDVSVFLCLFYADIHVPICVLKNYIFSKYYGQIKLILKRIA